jgi:hypothetical protein
MVWGGLEDGDLSWWDDVRSKTAVGLWVAGVNHASFTLTRRRSNRIGPICLVREWREDVEKRRTPYRDKLVPLVAEVCSWSTKRSSQMQRCQIWSATATYSVAENNCFFYKMLLKLESERCATEAIWPRRERERLLDWHLVVKPSLSHA